MGYNDAEKEVLSLLGRTDFKHPSKGDMIRIYSKVDQIRPEALMQILKQYPQLVGLIQSFLVEYRDTLDAVIKSDDESIHQFYEAAERAQGYKVSRHAHALGLHAYGVELQMHRRVIGGIGDMPTERSIGLHVRRPWEHGERPRRERKCDSGLR